MDPRTFKACTFSFNLGQASETVVLSPEPVWGVAGYSLNIFPSCSFMRFDFPFI